MFLIPKNDFFLCHWGRSWRDGAPGVGTGNWRKGNRISKVSYSNYKVKKINGLTAEEFIKSKSDVKVSNILMLPEPTKKSYQEPTFEKENLKDFQDRISKKPKKELETPDTIYAKGKDYYGVKTAEEFIKSKSDVKVSNILMLPEKVEKAEPTKKSYQEPTFEKENLKDFQDRISKKPKKELETPDTIYAKGKIKYEPTKIEISKKKKSYESPSITKDMDQKTATEILKADTEYRRALKENESIKNSKMTSDQSAKAASYFKGASSLTGEVTKGVDKAWNSLHDLKYADEDRSKNVRGLTNEELRKTIERIKLDQEYNRITMPPKSKGYDRTMAALGALGSVLAVTATGLTIVAGAKKIKER